ncbi:co-chaperone DjlA [Endozoicomonas sp. OPT23]|uniref:co-chaperone DjlA n=1 Tax=Endozoicomonas sp. OPT23 TaxID=2072845 RepID=UPI00129B075B|nr:co-chaperone DjlA [Endozoicomonas sp. OPT23]MRI33692.1 co-chaperone DjlA [Endozoicomonas sp. OPT23]
MTSILVGIFLGFFFGGPLGAVFGGFLGAWVNKNYISQNTEGQSNGNGFYRFRTQSAFFNATFLVMGRLAKADGRVSEHEIQMAAAIMNKMRLSSDQKKAAIELFNKGKQPGSDIDTALHEFRRVVGFNTLCPFFLEVQLQAAYADGSLTEAERQVFVQVCQALGVSDQQFEQIHQRFIAQQSYYQNQSGGGGGWSAANSGFGLSKAYEVLGVSESASDAEVKRAYRKLMSQHHPDKLVAKGLPEEMMEVAKQKAQEIQVAYEQVREDRKRPR